MATILQANDNSTPVSLSEDETGCSPVKRGWFGVVVDRYIYRGRMALLLYEDNTLVYHCAASSARPTSRDERWRSQFLRE